MGNMFLTPEVVAKEALMVLQSNLVMADLVHRDYSDEFVNVGDTITVRKPAKFMAKNFTGSTVVQDITEGSEKVTLDRFRDVTVAVTSKLTFPSRLWSLPCRPSHRPSTRICCLLQFPVPVRF